MRTLTAHFDGKVIVPDEPVSLRKGQRLKLQVTILRTTKNPRRKRSALDQIAELAVEDDGLPADLGHQHDHYLYGTPKKPEPGADAVR
jgi:hypothetical protein